MEMIETKVANHYGNGPAVKYEFRSNGNLIGTGSHRSRGWAEWTFLAARGSTYETFTSKRALVAFVSGFEG